MDATLRVTPHQSDASVVNKEGVIEQQDNTLATGFEMLDSLSVGDDEELLLSEFTGTAEFQAPQSPIASESSLPFVGTEVAVNAALGDVMHTVVDEPPKSTQQTVEELAAAHTRKLNTSSIMPSSHQLAGSDTLKAMINGVTINSESGPSNALPLDESTGKLSASSIVLSSHQLAASDTPKTMVNSMTINSEIRPSNALPLHELTSVQNATHKAEITFPAFHRGEVASAALSDLQPVSGVASNANATDLAAPVKTLQWAKVDLSAMINNQQDKSLVASQIGEKLNAILQDKINIQAANGIKSAQIRLDPPDMGHIKLIVAIEGDKVSVNMSAQNSTVREGLMQTSERLRSDLVNDNFVHAAINIDAGNAESGGKGANKEQEPETIANNLFVEQEVQLEPQDAFIVKI